MTTNNIRHFIGCTVLLMVLALVLGLAGCSKKAVKASSPGAVAGGSVSSGTSEGAQLRVGDGGVLSEVEKEKAGDVEIRISRDGVGGKVGDTPKRMVEVPLQDTKIGKRGSLNKNIKDVIVVKPIEEGESSALDQHAGLAETEAETETDAKGDTGGHGSAVVEAGVEYVLGPAIVAAVQPEAVAAPAKDTFFVKAGFENIYFDFNRWQIPAPMVERLTAHASWLRAHSESKVRIEGHCDIRGSREYNMVLGERRAQSVKDFLRDLGVNESQLSLISYGKERLTCFEGREECHQGNRRAHLILQ